METTYVIGIEGLRKSKTTGDETRNYSYKENGYVLVENEEPVVYGHTALAKKSGTSYYYYLYNAHGDVTAIVDETGNILNSYEYTPWGEISAQTETVENDIKYAGEYYDEESGLIYLRNRYYDPSVRRFTSEDPARDDLNWYCYCGNNPVNFVDPTGEFFDAILDFGGFLWSLYDYIKNPSIVNGAFVWSDFLSILIPFVPGSYLTKSGKYIVKSVDKADSLMDTIKGLNKSEKIKILNNGSIALPYKALRKLTAKTGLEAHHLIEKRFASRLGINSDEILSVALDKDTHRRITTAFRTKIPYGSTARNASKLNTYSASPQQIWNAIVDVYKEEGMTDYLSALKETLINAGHKLDWRGY